MPVDPIVAQRLWAQPEVSGLNRLPMRPPLMYFTVTEESETMVPIPMRWRRPIALSGTRYTPSSSGSTRRYSGDATRLWPPRATKSSAHCHSCSVRSRYDQAMRTSPYSAADVKPPPDLAMQYEARYFGAEGLRARLAEHVRLAQMFAGWIDAAPGWERVAPVPFSVVCFRAVPPGLTGDNDIDAFNEGLLESVNRSGEFFLSHTRLDGRFVIRLAVGNLQTTEDHVRRAWELLRQHASLRAVSPL